jgi:hypothetical protein
MSGLVTSVASVENGPLGDIIVIVIISSVSKPINVNHSNCANFETA